MNDKENAHMFSRCRVFSPWIFWIESSFIHSWMHGPNVSEMAFSQSYQLHCKRRTHPVSVPHLPAPGCISNSKHSWPSHTLSCPALVTLNFLLMLGSASHKGRCCGVWMDGHKRLRSGVLRIPMIKNGSGETLGTHLMALFLLFCCIWWCNKRNIK